MERLRRFLHPASERKGILDTQRMHAKRWIEVRQRDQLTTNYVELSAESRATDEPHNHHNHNNCSYQTQT
jgi:hypothetical protein